MENMFLWRFSKTNCFHSQHISRYVTVHHRFTPAWIQREPGNMNVRFLHSSNSSEFTSIKKPQYGWQYLRWALRPLPLVVAFTTFGVVRWHLLKKKSEEGTLKEANEFEVTCYCSVPLRVMSRGWGWVTDRELPVKLRPVVYSRYASAFGVNLEEAASEDLTTYPSLADFFCRPLKDGVRPIDHSDCVVSPADGRVLNVGQIHSCRVEQVKGVTYNLKTFLGEQTWNDSQDKGTSDTTEGYECSLLEDRNNVLYQCVVYLAPGDYHRFHSPVQWTVHFRRHFQGELLSVNPAIAHWIPDLFALNERAAYIGRWKHGFFALVAVGATNVGSIHIYCDPSLKTNERKWPRGQPRHRDLFLSNPDGSELEMKKGESFGEFRLGSTVVILFEAPPDFKFQVQPGNRIQVGKAINQCSS